MENATSEMPLGWETSEGSTKINLRDALKLGSIRLHENNPHTISENLAGQYVSVNTGYFWTSDLNFNTLIYYIQYDRLELVEGNLGLDQTWAKRRIICWFQRNYRYI